MFKDFGENPSLYMLLFLNLIVREILYAIREYKVFDSIVITQYYMLILD